MADEDYDALDEIDWDPKPMLRPGVDYHNGVTYFTVPLLRTVVIPGKPATKTKPGTAPKITKEQQTFAVTSDRVGIWYDADSLDRHGFRINSQFLQEIESRWSRESIKAFLDGEVSAPSSKDLFEEIKQIYLKYVEYSDPVYWDIMTLYVMYTYVFRLFESTGYIHFNGTAASGKSRNLALLSALAFNAIWASSLSPAALYRKLAGSPGTTCIDESEGFEGERGTELRLILNAGYKDGSQVGRSERGPNDKWITVMFDVYGPKVLASINPLEPVIASRCLIVGMRPAIRELPEFLSHSPEWQQMRDKLYLWALENTEAIAGLVLAWQDSTPNGRKARLAPRLVGRQWETTAQYIVLADYIGGEELASKLITFFNNYFSKQQEALDATDRIRTTLRVLPRVLSRASAFPGQMYSVKTIHEIIVEYMEADSAEYFKSKHVVKNLETLGFKQKARAAGGIRVQLDESLVRQEFLQRRVDPFDEDKDWLAGKISYQHGVPDKPQAPSTPWWDMPEADTEELDDQ